jgi:hypothetical protein
MNPKFKDQEPFNPRTGDYDRYDPSLTPEENLLNGLWVRPNPEPAEVFDIRVYAMTFDGYGYAERFLEQKDSHAVFEVADRIRKRFRETGKLEGSFTELRLALFAEQRRLHNNEQWPGFDESCQNSAGNYLVILNKAICKAWDREVGH